MAKLGQAQRFPSVIRISAFLRYSSFELRHFCIDIVA